MNGPDTRRYTNFNLTVIARLFYFKLLSVNVKLIHSILDLTLKLFETT